MAEKNYLIVHGKSAREPAVKAAVKAVKNEGLDLRVLVPFNQSETTRIVHELMERGAERIIAGGGDGTINAVVNAIVGDGEVKPEIILGVCPLGTANDFARGCGLPAADLAECLRIACTREGRATDVGVLNGRSFINVASLGFGAEVTATAPTELKKALGGGAYTLMGLVKALNMTPYEGRVLIPGQEALEGSMLFMAVGNSHFAGGGFDVAPLAKTDDGLLDLTAVRGDGGLNIAGLKDELDNPMNPANKHVFYRQLAEFTIQSDRKIHCNLDGEPLLKKKLKFSVRPRHLRVAY